MAWGPLQHTGDRGLVRLAESFAGQEDVGLGGGVLIRLARFLQGDPSSFISVSASFLTQQGLPDNTPAHSAVLQVTVSPARVRFDAGNVGASDMLLPVGTIIKLTGQPTIKGFVFLSTAVSNTVMVGQFFT